MRGKSATLFALLLALLLATGVSGCATYSEKIQAVRSEFAAGRPEAAIAIVGERLGTATPEDVPADFGGDHTLLLLERAALLQALGDHRLSARDLSLADNHLEFLEIDGADSLDLGRYLFSDDAVPYRAPPYERLLLNLLNGVNYLAMGDVDGAKVEARRFRILEAYYVDSGGKALLPDLLALGNYVAGVAFEGGREYSEAARHYARAIRFGLRDPDLPGRLRDLFRVTGAPAKEVEAGGEALAGIAREAAWAGPLSAGEYRRAWVDGSLLVVVQSGFAPYKRPERVPIGLALTWAASVHHGHSLSHSERERAEKLMVEGLVKWLAFPELTRDGVAGGSGVAVQIDGRPAPSPSSLDVAAQVEAGWEQMKPALVVAAISRMLVRVAAGYGARKAVEGGTKKSGSGDGTASDVGWLAGLAVEAVLTAADTPDTRSWTMLPARITLVRMRPRAGARTISVTVAGRREDLVLDPSPYGTSTAVFSRFR